MTTTADLPSLPALVVGRVHHARVRPIRHTFGYRHYQWLVDLDAMPVLPFWLRAWAGFRGKDHLSGASDLSALKDEVLTTVSADGIEAFPAGRVVMLAHPRVLGHVFNPMTAYWCFAPGGELRAVLIEVHNTYGGRHTYVVRPDPAGSAAIDKAFYVSPFNDVSGTYAVRLTMTPKRVAVGITLRVDGSAVMSATATGTPRRATPAAVLRAALTHPLMTYQVSGLIRLHGIRLWLRRLPVRPPPTPTVEEGGQ